MNNIRRQILEHLRTGSRAALATVIRTSGSAPQVPGSSALFGEDGLIAGTIGGGQIEGEVQHIADRVMISGVSDCYFFSLDHFQGEEGAICGGEALVLVDATPADHIQAFEEMEGSVSNRKSGFLLTIVHQKVENGRNLDRYWIPEENPAVHLPDLDPVIHSRIKDQLKDLPLGRAKEIELTDTAQHVGMLAFMERVEPLPELIIAGAGHVGRALAHLASLLDFEITVIDDRQEFANSRNIPDADHFIVKEIGEAAEEMKIGRDTYVVIVTRGHRYDAEVLKSCIGSKAAYIGMIGSRHKVEVMRKEFLEKGWATTEQWALIHTPIGIEINSVTVQEIAVSIAAQLISVRNKKQRTIG